MKFHSGACPLCMQVKPLPRICDGGVVYNCDDLSAASSVHTKVFKHRCHVK